MRLNDRTTDRQSDAHSILLSAVEEFESLFLVGNPRAGIADLDDNPAVDVPRTNDELLWTIRSLHRLGGIAYQVHQHLLNLDTVGGYRRHLLREIQFPQDASPAHLTLQQLPHLLDYLVHLQLGFIRRRVRE